MKPVLFEMYKKLSEFLPKEFFLTKKISIVEKGSKNADFIIRDLILTHGNLKIYSFYRNKQHYSGICKECKLENIETIFDSSELSIQDHDIILIDDFYTFSEFYFQKYNCITEFKVYRSESFNDRNFYKSDIHIFVSPLDSGVSDKIDGIIKIFDSKKVYLQAKFKVFEAGTQYYVED